MRLRMRPKTYAAAFHSVREPLQIVFERVEIDDQRRGVDLVEAHADLGGWAHGHRRSPILKLRRRLAQQAGKCNTAGAKENIWEGEHGWDGGDSVLRGGDSARKPADRPVA